MTTETFLNNFISPNCHKVHHSVTEYAMIKNNPFTSAIKATTFYQIYKHNVYPTSENRLTMQEFFRVCGQYFYYDKYVCDHGTEFYYYVQFNEGNPIYEVTKHIVNKKIYANRPEKLKDLKYIVEAVTKQ